jgi:transcriptional regulator with XRE-family HTH domain
MTAYGEALARYRIEAGLNQRELGAAIGLDSTQLNKVERGHRPPLGAKYVKPLVRALRLTQSEAKHLVVDLAGLSPKVLDFMDEGENVEAEEEASGGVQPALAGLVSLGSGVGLGTIPSHSRTDKQQTETATQQRDQSIKLLVTQIVDEKQLTLTPEERLLAERLILENARAVCEVLAQEQDQ